MISNKIQSISILLVLMLICQLPLWAQSQYKLTGTIKDATSNLPLESVLVSFSTENTVSNVNGEYEIDISNENVYLVFQIPGYTSRLLKVHGRTQLDVAMVKSEVKSMDDLISSPLGDIPVRDLTWASSYITPNDFGHKANSSLDQVFQGKLNGTQTIMGSGMPGSKSFITIRGMNSLYGRNEPLVIIDGMMHPIHYANYSAIDGFTINTLDVVDIDDVESVSVFGDGNSHLGSLGSNGVIYINTEQKRETSSRIVVNSYGGIAFSPKRQSLLDAEGFKQLFNEQVSQLGLTDEQLNNRYSFLNAQENTEEYYRYNNNTNWQDEIYQVGTVQKHHIFIKGGDDIATYNISAGYLQHDGILKNTSYNRINVRINGKVNITEKFTVLPNTKVSLSDSYLMEQGYNMSTNPVLAAQAKSPLMVPQRMDANGNPLEFIDDVGVFNVSNPTSIVSNVLATNRNYHFMTSVKGIYAFTKNLSLSTLIGIDYNNGRDNIFIPDIGLTSIGDAYNTMRALVNEYRSTQNQNQLQYKKVFANKNSLALNLGHRYISNKYEYDKATDLNSTTDEFRSLGQGANNTELRTISGENRVVKWVSYFATADYNIKSKYFFSAAFSYDVNSAFANAARYNFYPSISGAWRVSSEPFLNGKSWLDDLKIRASFSQAGNLNNFAYDYSYLYYRGLKLVNVSVPVREAVPDPDMEMEKQNTINLGADMVLFGQKLNLTLNVFSSVVNNLVTKQTLQPAYGYAAYYTNAGSIQNQGFDAAFNYRKKSGPITWSIGATVAYVDNQVTSLDFFQESEAMIVHQIEGATLITKAGGPMYSFYGFKTNGIFANNDEASAYTGPNGQKAQAGDIRYVDVDNNNIIDDRDKMSIGSPIANIYGGLNASLEYGRFKINADVSFSSGNNIYSHVNRQGQSMELGHNQQDVVGNRWSESNTNTTIPAARVGDPYGNNAFSDRWLEKGDYARLKALTVSYLYPGSTKVFENLTIYVTATNLFTLSNYSGLDPESMLYNDPLYMGSDYGKMQQPTMVVLGIKLGL